MQFDTKSGCRVHRYVKASTRTENRPDRQHWVRVGDLNSKSHEDRESFWVSVDETYGVPNELPYDFHKTLLAFLLRIDYTIVGISMDEDSAFHKLYENSQLLIDNDCVFLNFDPRKLTPEQIELRKQREIKKRSLQAHHKKYWDMCIQCTDRTDPRWLASSYSIGEYEGR